jgi:hypothetical protein
MCIYVNQGKYKEEIMVIGREDEPTMVGESKFVCEEIVSE